MKGALFQPLLFPPSLMMAAFASLRPKTRALVAEQSGVSERSIRRMEVNSDPQRQRKAPTTRKYLSFLSRTVREMSNDRLAGMGLIHRIRFLYYGAGEWLLLLDEIRSATGLQLVHTEVLLQEYCRLSFDTFCVRRRAEGNFQQFKSLLWDSPAFGRISTAEEKAKILDGTDRTSIQAAIGSPRTKMLFDIMACLEAEMFYEQFGDLDESIFKDLFDPLQGETPRERLVQHWRSIAGSPPVTQQELAQILGGNDLDCPTSEYPFEPWDEPESSLRQIKAGEHEISECTTNRILAALAPHYSGNIEVERVVILAAGFLQELHHDLVVLSQSMGIWSQSDVAELYGSHRRFYRYWKSILTGN